MIEPDGTDVLQERYIQDRELDARLTRETPRRTASVPYTESKHWGVRDLDEHSSDL